MASSPATTPDSAAFPEPAEPTVARRVLILLMVVMGSTLYATTLLIASTLLPQMQGTMSATQDEIAWAMTFNILATAVATPMSGWLANRMGWRRLMLEGGSVAVAGDDDVTSNRQVREMETRIRELERQLGRKTLEVEILKEALERSRPKKASLLMHSPLPETIR